MSAEAQISSLSARARLTALMDHLAATLAVVRADEVPAVEELLCAWLDDGGGRGPSPSYFGAIRDDAAFWADIATPAELEAHVAAGLRRIERRHFGAHSRKRLFVALWESMGEADRRSFIARVDPEGRFRGRAA